MGKAGGSVEVTSGIRAVECALVGGRLYEVRFEAPRRTGCTLSLGNGQLKLVDIDLPGNDRNHDLRTQINARECPLWDASATPPSSPV